MIFGVSLLFMKSMRFVANSNRNLSSSIQDTKKKIDTSRDAFDYADYESVLTRLLSLKLSDQTSPNKGCYNSEIKLRIRNIYTLLLH